MVLNCEDRLSIHELLGRYYRLLDGDDRIAVEAIFTEDAALIVPTVRFADRKAIAAFFCSRPRGAGRAGRHFITNIVVDGRSDGRAEAGFYLLYVGTAGPALKMTGTGTCNLRKTASGWRVERFQIEIDPAATASNA